MEDMIIGEKDFIRLFIIFLLGFIYRWYIITNIEIIIISDTENVMYPLVYNNINVNVENNSSDIVNLLASLSDK